jgi:hypothetical protein
VQWAELLAGVSACRELEMLVLPQVRDGSYFPPGTAFARLTHLELANDCRAQPPGAGVMGLWDLMASGGLPALAKLKVRLEGPWRGEEMRACVAPAFEAVASTLTHLQLQKVGAFGEELGVGYELGAAVGKLRRLQTFVLDLFNDGRAYHALAQGLAATGGDRPLPLLQRVILPSEVKTNADLLASLLLPSVRVFRTCYPDHDKIQVLLTACAIRRAGYKHTWFCICSFDRCVRDVIPGLVQCSTDGSCSDVMLWSFECTCSFLCSA